MVTVCGSYLVSPGHTSTYKTIVNEDHIKKRTHERTFRPKIV